MVEGRICCSFGLQLSLTQKRPSVFTTPSFITEINVTLMDMEVDYAQGYFGQQVLQDTVETNIDFLNKIKGGFIDLPAMELLLSLTNGVKVDGRLKIDKVATNKNGIVTELSHSSMGQTRNVNRAIGSYGTLSPSVLEYDFTPTNSNIEAFIESLSSDIKVIYSLEINPNGNISGSIDEIYLNSYISFDLALKMPLAIGFHHLKLEDTIAMGLNDVGNKIRKCEGGKS